MPAAPVRGALGLLGARRPGPRDALDLLHLGPSYRSRREPARPLRPSPPDPRRCGAGWARLRRCQACRLPGPSSRTPARSRSTGSRGRANGTLSWPPGAGPRPGGLSRRDSGRAVLSLEDGPASQAVWPHRFRLEYEVELTGPDTIRLELRVVNPADAGELKFTGCLHTYIAVNAGATAVRGLAGKSYVDKCDGMKVKSSHAELSSVESMAEQSGTDAGKPGFVDRVYEAVDQVTLETDKGSVLVSQEGWPNTTVYNPWRGDKLGGAAAGLDFSEDGYLQMLCVEPTIGQAEQPVVVPAGGSWSGSQTIQVIDDSADRACCC